jgi:hypothetical protein
MFIVRVALPPAPLEWQFRQLLETVFPKKPVFPVGSPVKFKEISPMAKREVRAKAVF